VREILDTAGLRDTSIVASGDLDEHRIRDIVSAGAPVDGFGVGTAVSTSSDAPALSGVYKLAEMERNDRFVPVAKKSEGKATFGGRKQVWRVFEAGVAVEDVVTLATEPAPAGDARPLLREVIRGGVRTSSPTLFEAREYCRAERATLPPAVRAVSGRGEYPVRISDRVVAATTNAS
jgi:nicotinate phosphoribosyltransferase